MAVYLVSDGTNKPYKCKIRAPGFLHLVNIYCKLSISELEQYFSCKDFCYQFVFDS